MLIIHDALERMLGDEVAKRKCEIWVEGRVRRDLGVEVPKLRGNSGVAAQVRVEGKVGEGSKAGEVHELRRDLAVSEM
jgi:hypothetical protein